MKYGRDNEVVVPGMPGVITSFLAASQRRALFILVALVTLDAVLFSSLGAIVNGNAATAVTFLDVGQGDSTLVEFSGLPAGGVQVLIDGGPPNGRLLAALGETLSPTDRTIDLIVMSHPQLDHYGGFIELLGRYRVGAFIETGVEGETESYAALARALAEHNVPRVALRAGDRIRYRDHVFTALSPSEKFLASRELNDTSLVLALKTEGVHALFTGDIGADVERALAHVINLPFDVLKVAHHGSKFSSTAEFLRAVSPLVAAIGVGKNSYGHPTKEALARLEATGARIYRTDQDGAVTVRAEKGTLRVFTEN